MSRTREQGAMRGIHISVPPDPRRGKVGRVNRQQAGPTNNGNRRGIHQNLREGGINFRPVGQNPPPCGRIRRQGRSVSPTVSATQCATASVSGKRVALWEGGRGDRRVMRAAHVRHHHPWTWVAHACRSWAQLGGWCIVSRVAVRAAKLRGRRTST